MPFILSSRISVFSFHKNDTPFTPNHLIISTFFVNGETWFTILHDSVKDVSDAQTAIEQIYIQL